jgi:hypothetical protein
MITEMTSPVSRDVKGCLAAGQALERVGNVSDTSVLGDVSSDRMGYNFLARDEEEQSLHVTR